MKRDLLQSGAETIAEVVRRTREEQGLPAKISDPLALDALVRFVKVGSRNANADDDPQMSQLPPR